MVFLRYNHILFGCLLGSVAPLIAFFFTEYHLVETLTQRKPLLAYVLSAAVNLILLRYLYKNEKDGTARGVILVTFACMLLLLYLKGFKV
ncbi:hypothetical protein [Olivibacter sitiensis]|uniref:hypothetical protein n=1 Tax=Olivibacter sitiensis TaxID=376470 RepID=UPI000427AF41|nr:hypothetical protein [Olivibacter sitiensis]